MAHTSGLLPLSINSNVEKLGAFVIFIASRVSSNGSGMERKVLLGWTGNQLPGEELPVLCTSGATELSG